MQLDCVQAEHVRAKPRVYTFLPEELWLKIASQFPLRDWVRASGNCNALHHMELDKIEEADIYTDSRSCIPGPSCCGWEDTGKRPHLLICGFGSVPKIELNSFHLHHIALGCPHFLVLPFDHNCL